MKPFPILSSRLSLGIMTIIFASIAQVASALGLIMPIYGNTSAQFNAAVTAASKVPTLAVINPSDGPGGKKIVSIANQVKRLKGVGARVAGYIDTNYGKESLGSVYSQIDNYKKWYTANGVFLDEVSDQNGKVAYYRSIFNYAHKKGMVLVLNPGTFVPAGFYSVSDLLVTYEDPLSAGWSSASQSAWVSGKPASRFGAMVYATPAANMQAVIDRAVTQTYGWIYVTNVGGNDPFGTAPSYITALTDAIKAKNAPKP